MNTHAKKKLGVIGGLGPLATVRFFERVVHFTKAEKDQDHLEICILSRPQTPDRTAFLTGESQDCFVEPLQKTARELEEMACEVIALTCNTAHTRYEEISSVLEKAHLINMVEEARNHLERKKIYRCGILATKGTISTGLYQDMFGRVGIEAVAPDVEGQQLLTDIIYKDIKGGTVPPFEKLLPLVKYFEQKACEALVLACTELSALDAPSCIEGMEIVDALDVLAVSAIERCGAEVDVKHVPAFFLSSK